MKIRILTLFPGFFSTPIATSLVGKARASNRVEIDLIQIRDFTTDKHRTVDDHPYGGGEGMVIRADVLGAAVTHALGKSELALDQKRVILMSPQGPVFKQAKARLLAQFEELILICGHYEGVDERFIEAYVDEELSIGDYVLTGGEIAACVVLETVTRLLPGVVGNPDSISKDSFEESLSGLLKYPQYTKPRTFEGRDVPEVLLSGDHRAIAQWRKEQTIARTAKKRPDLSPPQQKLKKSLDD